MKRSGALLCLVCLSWLTVAAEEPVPTVTDRAQPLVIGHVLEIRSAVLDEDRRLMIAAPPRSVLADGSFPVIYLLDGGSQFHLTTAIVDLLARQNLMPPSIVVGIVNTDRSRDLTAAATEGRSSGGADRFLEFLQTELIPLVDRSFDTAPHRILIGHSLGGSFALHAVAERPGLFAAAIAISPAITNDERVVSGIEPLSHRLASRFAKPRTDPFSLFISMSGGEDPLWRSDLVPVLEILRADAPGTMRWTYVEFPEEDHGTTVLASTRAGLGFIHADWDLRPLVRDGTIDELVRRCEAISARLGVEVRPSENDVNQLGYRRLAAGATADAVAAFELNVATHPGSANVHDSLGEALERAGRLPGALRSYRRAVDRAEAAGDRRLPIYRANLDRVERALFEAGTGSDPGVSPWARGPSVAGAKPR